MDSGRFWEVDVFRGAAIVMMVVYHVAWDLGYFGYYAGDLAAGPWLVFQRAVLTAFVFVAGVSLWLSYARRERVHFGWYVRRGLKLLGWGFCITAVTALFLKEGTVFFGVLHLIGLAVICAYPFLRLGLVNLLLGAGLLVLGDYLERVPVDFPYLLWLGLCPPDLYMVDYVPFVPWFGVVLLGLSGGFVLYPGGRRLLRLEDASNFPPVRLLGFLGRKSLFIYLMHQPVLFGLFSALQLLQHQPPV
ncbi:MAG: heparan-alpha-glucosaminide N-acetyltransferase [Bacillota bacterium]